MGTWGTGAFDSDGALDLLETLKEQDEARRRQTLERVFREAEEHQRDLDRFTWLRGWVDAEDEVRARQTTDQLAAVLHRYGQRD